MKFLAFILIFSIALASEAKPFRRALIIAGGGFSPGVGIGIIAGLQKLKLEPDLIIASSGAAMSAAIYNSTKNLEDAQLYLTGETWFETMGEMQLKVGNIVSIIQNDFVFKNANASDNYSGFSAGIFGWNENARGFLPNPDFSEDAQKPRFIIVASRAHFDGARTGASDGKIFSEVYFTDAKTSTFLQQANSSIAEQYPESQVNFKPIIISAFTMEAAMRASVADPELFNPAIIEDQKYFGGSINLYPIELAAMLADEVIATLPVQPMQEAENSHKTAFGYSSTLRNSNVLKNSHVRWIDLKGIDEISFNPSFWSGFLLNNIPDDFEDFKAAVKGQFDFGFACTTALQSPQ